VLPYWILFNLFALAMVTFDLRVLGRRGQGPRVGEALRWSASWIGLAAAFGALIFFWHGRAEALQFATGYVVELSLSADNLFIFALIFRYFNVSSEYQHRVLFYGVLGAMAARGLFIAAGVELMQRFEWITYAFGGLLIYSGVKLLGSGDREIHPEKNPVLRLFRRTFPVTEENRDGKFFVRETRWSATPLFVVLLVVETTDMVFATDSIPAVLAITRNAFLVYTSNVFAILGLRSMYFALAGMMNRFCYLHYGLAAVLIFTGLKMAGERYVHVPTEWALGVVVMALGISMAASLGKRDERWSA